MRASLLVFLCLLLTSASQAQVITGSLGPGDPTRNGGEWYEEHAFQVTTPRKVTIRMESADFDTYLLVRSPSGIETENDDFDGQRVSQVEVWATESGRWTIWATQYSPDSTGSYTLRIEEGASAEVSVVQGRLDHQDPVALKGEYFDTHAWEMDAGRQLIVELLSLGFDGYLVVTAPSGEVWRNDDEGSTSLSRVGPVTGAGKWRIDVTSNAEGETGAYDLRLIVVQ